MVGIWEFENVDLVENYLEELYDETIKLLIDADQPLPPGLNLETIYITGDWGDGTAERGEDPLEILLSVSVEFDVSNLDEELREQFFDFTSELSNTMENAALNIQLPPEIMRETFAGLEVRTVESGQVADQMLFLMGDVVQNTVVNLTDRVVIEFVGGRNFERLSRTPLDEYAEGEEEDLLLFEDLEEEEEPEEEEEEEPEPEEFLPRFDETLGRYKTDNKLVIPAGKGAKDIEPRTPYDFEIEMASPSREMSVDIRETEFVNFAQSEAAELRDELYTTDEPNVMFFGESIRRARFGEEDPPGTFPRTGAYLSNRLFYEGVGYLYELYKDLVYYSGLISMVYESISQADPESFLKEPQFKAGRYISFREYVFVLEEITKGDEGPELIEVLSQQQAAARGLEVRADHGATGEKTDWLENRKYIDVIEDNKDHEAWKNPYNYHYPDEEKLEAEG